MNNDSNLSRPRSSEPVCIFHALCLREKKLAREWLDRCRQAAREGAARRTERERGGS
jgi:hypothetical protein